MVIKRIKEGLSRVFAKSKEPVEDYIEIDLGRDAIRKSKIIIRPFILKVFEDVNPILNILREGYTIAVIDIKQLKSKDIVELKRAIAKLKKTADALEGSVSGFGENTIIAAPSFAEIYKGETIRSVESVEKR
ncbi:MAG: cell division protein SepF [archaeon]